MKKKHILLMKQIIVFSIILLINPPSFCAEQKKHEYKIVNASASSTFSHEYSATNVKT